MTDNELVLALKQASKGSHGDANGFAPRPSECPKCLMHQAAKRINLLQHELLEAIEGECERAVERDKAEGMVAALREALADMSDLVQRLNKTRTWQQPNELELEAAAAIEGLEKAIAASSRPSTSTVQSTAPSVPLASTPKSVHPNVAVSGRP